MKAYSTDLRERVLAALDNGMPRRDAIRLFQVSQGSITRWLRLRRLGRDLAPLRPSGRPLLLPPDQHNLLQQQAQAAPDASLAEQATQWQAEQGTSLSRWTIARSLRRAGWSRKKRL